MNMYDFKKTMYHIVNAIAKICYIGLIVAMIVLIFCKQSWWVFLIFPIFLVITIQGVIYEIFFSGLHKTWWDE